MTDDNDAATPAAVEPEASAATDTQTATAAPTLKVRIDAGGREIELETSHATQSVDTLVATALRLWQATDDALHPTQARSAFGLVSSERARHTNPTSTMDYPLESPR